MRLCKRTIFFALWDDLSRQRSHCIAQDWELSISGFIVVCPVKKHVERLCELDNETVSKMFLIVKKIENILRKNNVAEEFNIVAEEKPNIHYRIWIMPKREWVFNIHESSMARIEELFDYAKSKFKIKETSDGIEKIAVMHN